MIAVHSALELLRYAKARLYYAGEARGHREAQDQAGDAVDALFGAAQISPEPIRTDLFRLRHRLDRALRLSKGLHPDPGALSEVDQAIDDVVEKLKGLRS